MRPAKTRSSLGIRPVWSVVAVRKKLALVFSYPFNAQQRLWSDWAYAKADLSLQWAHMPLFWFCHAQDHLSSLNQNTKLNVHNNAMSVLQLL